jgi:hypothetical protein
MEDIIAAARDPRPQQRHATKDEVTVVMNKAQHVREVADARLEAMRAYGEQLRKG